jgi:hypothetical protein
MMMMFVVKPSLDSIEHKFNIARGAWGSWGLKTENRNIFSLLFHSATTTKNKIKIIILFFFDPTVAGRGARWGRDEGETGCPTGCLTGARWGARRGPDGVPDEDQTGCQTGARQGAR